MGILGLLLFLMIPSDNPTWIAYDPSYHYDLDSSAAPGLKKAFVSSVVIHSLNESGFVSTGSGNFFRIHNQTFILTAAHVVNNSAILFVSERSGDMHPTKVALINEAADIAILVTDDNLLYTKAINYTPETSVKIGEEIFYCGHPNYSYYTSYRGMVSASDGNFILLDSFAWPGSSGSAIFNRDGNVVGIVSSVSSDDHVGTLALIPNMVRASSTIGYTRKYISEALSNVRE